MVREYVKLIKTLRTKRGISQLELAKKLGISRPSYIAIEQGKRELTLSEAQKLADIFGFDLDEMKSGLVPNYEKYKEMILAYLRQAERADDGKLPKTKLAKLLYLADFGWFYHHLESMSGMAYRKFQYGPVPDAYFRAIDELQEEGKINVGCAGDSTLISENRGSRRQPLKSLNKNELAFIAEVAGKWKNRRTKEIVDFTHNQLPYLVSHENEIVPYEAITQENPGDVY